METIKIKSAGLADLKSLQKIGRNTFSETFSNGNDEENLFKYLEESFSVHKLKLELSEPSSQFYFAVSDQEVIGYMKLNTGQSQTELKDQAGLEIERIYVLQAYHGQKVGQLLYEKALSIAQEKNVEYIWLGVWENNHRAIGFYQKNEFVAFDKHFFKLGDDEQTDIMMKKKLR